MDKKKYNQLIDRYRHSLTLCPNKICGYPKGSKWELTFFDVKNQVERSIFIENYQTGLTAYEAWYQTQSITRKDFSQIIFHCLKVHGNNKETT